MSYDLALYKKISSNVSSKEIKDYLLGNPNFEEEESQLLYSNPSTGVYFIADFTEEIDFEDEDLDDEDRENLKGYERLNIKIILNFIRAECFGFECFSVLKELTEKFDLYILDFQGDIKPIRFNFEEQFNAWLKVNNHSIKSYFDDSGHVFVEPEKAKQVWEYNYNKRKLEKKYEDVHVAQIVYVKFEDKATVNTIAIVGIDSAVIPKVDFLVFPFTKKKLFKKVDETRIVKFEDFLNSIKNDYQDFDNYIYIPDDKLDNVMDTLYFETKYQLLDTNNIVPYDSIVNVKP